ncbi:MAG: OmpA family protein [Tunicatimonas sp.]
MKYLRIQLTVFMISYLAAWPGQAQDFYFQPPVALSDTINSRAEESYPLYSARDSTLYFVRTLYSANVGGAQSGQDIWYTKRLPSGTWGLPANDLSKLNNRNNNAVVGVSKTGNTLYLLNSYEADNGSRPGLAFSFNQTSGWLDPSDVKIPKLSDKIGNFYGIFVSSSEDVAILSMQHADAVGQEDLYVTFKDSFSGDWSDPMHLGDTVNTEGYEMSPFLSEDQRHLFFASNGHPGYGNADIFVSTRLDSTWTRWSEPRNLGDNINSAGFDAYLTVAANDEVYFVSDRYGRSADIYTSKLVSKEDRDRQLASRIEGGRRPALDSSSAASSSNLDAETQALLAETQALLDEFKGVNQQAPTSSPAAEPTDPAEETRYLFFGLNSDELQSSSIPYLRDVAGLLTKDATRNVVLVGHADDTGGKDYNLKLSIERAQAAKRYLISQGVEEGQIVSYGRGSTQPLSDEGPEARRKNRRVEIKMD